MFKYLIPAMVVCAAASPALAQNDSEPVLGQGAGDWSDAPAPVAASRSVVFTAIGTFADQPAARLIDVRADSDADGDGKPDTGLLSVTCNGGDLLTGVFTLNSSLAARKAKPVPAPASAPYAAEKTIRARWTGAAAAASADKPVALSAGQSAICTGLG